MQISQKTILELLENDQVRYAIPLYQRSYAWGPTQAGDLLDDLARAGALGKAHFLGTFLYNSEPTEAGAELRVVIDGQQRITTVSLLVAALANHLDGQGGHPSSTLPSAQQLRTRFLQVHNPNTPLQPKLQSGEADNATFSALALQEPLPSNPSEKILEVYRYFEQRLKDTGLDLAQVWAGLSAAYLICAQADAADHTQLIFESLNSKGKPLTLADLVRNYLLIAKSHDEQARLYHEYWAPITGMFQPDPGTKKLDNAIWAWTNLRFRKANAHTPGAAYSLLKRYAEDEYTGTLEDLLEELRGFCLMWAENYRYHAVKKFKSSFDWAKNGPKTLVSDRAVKPASHEGSMSAADIADQVDERW